MFKRSFAILLILLLAFGGSSFAAGKPIIKKLDKETNFHSKKLEATKDPNQEVRVIIETEGDPAIETANEKDVKYNELADSTKKSLESKANEKHKKVKEKIKGKKIKAKYYNEFSTVFNGFSAEVKYKDIEDIRTIDGVKTVHIVNTYKRPEVKPEMLYSKELVQAQEAWEAYGYKGEGMVVGIIDTGIDYTHKDMILSNDTKGKLTEKEVKKIVTNNDLDGKYYTDKVPYGYNYYDKNDEIKDLGDDASMHGMHVSGTVAANGDEDHDGIKGVAPEAQLLALKVFSNDQSIGTTSGDVYVKAIDDAIKLGADVINMSLGSPSGFVDPESAEQEAVKRAVDNGVLMSISAGNSSFFGDGYYYPLASNPDYGVVGAPGVANESISVASFENTYMQVDGLQYSINGEDGNAGFLSASKTHPNDVPTKSFEVLAAGIGDTGDFAGKDFSGKYALVQRGTLDFVTKAINAQNAGAAGVIVYNNTDGIVNMATDASINIPQLFMLKNDGDKLREALDSGDKVTLSFNGDKQKINNPDAGKMSAFSSWGITPSLDFKPEITAPGGQILSTLNNNQYGVMSGTSMAAPHVSGGSALVLERVDKEFKLKNSSRVSFAKNLLLNTAKPVEFDGNYVSPRRQGAGLMQINAALSTPVIVTESKTKEAKVALKEIKGNKVTFQLAAVNYSNKDVKYNVEVNAQTDTPLNNGGEYINLPNDSGALDLNGLVDIKIDGKSKEQVVVPANRIATINVTLDVKKAEKSLKDIYTNGFWLEGFVRLVDTKDENPTLTVPYVGFKGEWDKAPIFDQPIWDASSYYGMAGVLTTLGNGDFGYLGSDAKTGDVNPDNIAFSPNGDGNQDDALPILSFLRNAKDFKVNILDSKKHKVTTVATSPEMYKDSYDNGNGTYYTLDPSLAWDGKVKGNTVKEGQYYIEVEAAVDYKKAKTQTLVMPVKVDMTAPSLDASYNKKKNTVTVHTSDTKNGSGIAYWDVLVDGKSVTNDAYYSADENKFTLSNDPGKGHEIMVVSYDNAGNVSSEVVSGAK